MSRSTAVRSIGAIALAAALTVSLAACAGKKAPAGSTDAAGHHKLVFGFSQVGAESGWRSANTKSIQDAAKAAGSISSSPTLSRSRRTRSPRSAPSSSRRWT